MPGTKMTFLICFDDHRSFSEDVKKRFSDTSKYNVSSFYTVPEFIDSYKKEREKSSCKVALIGIPDAGEQYEMIGNLVQNIKRSDPGSGIILLVSGEKMEDLKKIVRYNIDAYIPRNANSVLRIHNTVKKLISENNITIFRKRRNVSLYVLLAFIIITGLIILAAYLKLPQYF
jgi:hypothetical protein